VNSEPGDGKETRVRSKRGNAAHPAMSQSLSLLSEICQEITSVLDRDELFGRIANRVKKVADYHLFSVVLWNDRSCSDSRNPREFEFNA
jgi:hypothetical protein